MLPNLDKPCANIMNVSSSGRGMCQRNWTLQVHGNQGTFTGLGAGHCTLLLLKSNERCSVLTAVNTGDSSWHTLSWQNWDKSVNCYPQIHRPPTLPKTSKGTPSALGQTWTWAGQTLLQCLENCQAVILIFPMSLMCYGSYVKINIKEINWLVTLREIKWAKAGTNFGRPSNNCRECG